MESAIFEGFISHSRNTDIKHQFEYPIFMALLDLDRLDDFFSRSRLWSQEQWNWASFRRRDYLTPTEGNLKQAVVRKIEEQLNKSFNGRVFLLTHVRYLGFCFNPVSFYFCYEGNKLTYILADVNNTPWNQRHCYVLECNGSDTQEFSTNKAFHVSPFNPMDMRYGWRFTFKEDRIGINIKCYSEDNCDFSAKLSLEKRDANRKYLRNILFSYPAVTLKVVTSIYWQALKLTLKGASFYSNPSSQQESNNGKYR